MSKLDASWKSLTVPGVLTLIAFLTVSSQWLFLSIDPHPLTRYQAILFNLLVGSLLISYARLHLTNPGFVPQNWIPSPGKNGNVMAIVSTRRWCMKCQTSKPPRAHHCKHCKRCVLKMDHHCPWTMNCVSHCTLPHYIRFLFYAVTAMIFLECMLYTRFAAMWDKRNLPYYLGPSVAQLLHMIILGLINSFTLFTLSILFVRSVWSLGENTTTIEGWEIERHKALLRRARIQGGCVNGPHGQKVRLVKQEFPYDIGICSNFVQGMGTRNVLAWFWPFSTSPSTSTGFEFEENGFENPGTYWPPPDPDRMIISSPISAFNSKQPECRAGSESFQSSDWQQANMRVGKPHQRVRREFDSKISLDTQNQPPRYNTITPELQEPRWKNWEGETLEDFGVDEGAEVYYKDD